MRTVRQRRRLLTLPRQPAVITSVNAASNPYATQPGVVILGDKFGAVAGTLTYAGVTLETTSWTDTRITANWPDVPYVAIWAAVNYNVNYTLRVRTADNRTADRLVRTVKLSTDIVRTITATTAPSIFANDTGITAGMTFNWRTLSGTVSDVNSAGQPRGTSVGARGKYAVWTGTSWTNTANSVVQL